MYDPPHYSGTLILPIVYINPLGYTCVYSVSTHNQTTAVSDVQKHLSNWLKLMEIESGNICGYTMYLCLRRNLLHQLL